MAGVCFLCPSSIGPNARNILKLLLLLLEPHDGICGWEIPP